MKTEAVFLGHSDRLDRDCFHAAHRRLERRSILTQFTLWPFWPNGVAWLRRTRQGLAPVAALSVARRGPYHESREGDSVFHLERDEELLAELQTVTDEKLLRLGACLCAIQVRTASFHGGAFRRIVLRRPETSRPLKC